jgi:hypothetical protein
MKKYFFLLMILFFTTTKLTAQNIGINATGAAPDNSAILDVSATDKGMLVPRMTAALRMVIASPAQGLLVYQTDAPSGFYFYNGSSWNLLPVQAPGSFNFSFKNSAAQGFNASTATKASFTIQNFANNVTFSNSSFTAPSTGIYCFSVNMNMYGNSAASTRMGFYVNNVARSTTSFNIVYAVFQNIGFTDYLSLVAGDQVTVQLNPSVYISGFGVNFSGFKIN